MSSGATAQDTAWKSKEQAAEATWAHAREAAQLAALREQSLASKPKPKPDDIEGGFGGQEDLEDRYATTSGEH